MLSKKSFGIAGAAMLGTVALLGTNAANAAMNLDDDEMATVTYAQETVTEAVDDDMMYYKVSDTDNGTDSNALDVMSAIGVGAAQDETLIVTYTLTGMVFGADLMSDFLTLGDDKITAGERVLTTGGMAEDTEAVFHISNGDGTIEQTDVMMLDIDMLGVMASGGMISVSVRHELNTTGMGTSPDNYGAVNLASGIVETANGRNAKTYVVDNYMNLGPGGDGAPEDSLGTLSDDVGSFSIGTQHLNAQDGMDAELADVFGDAALMADAAGRMAASINFDEDMFGFAAEAWLETLATPATDTCAANFDDASSAYQVWDADADDDKLMPVGLGDLGTGTDTMTGTRHLCIGVDGMMTVPGTDYFTATTMYEGVDDAKIPPMDGMIMLGKIERDGITVQLPYLTTADNYNQRLVIVNRNRNAVAYSIEFAPEEGKTATPMGMADDEVEGTCVGQYDECEMPPHGVTTVISVFNIVEIGGRGSPRTAGTLMLESIPGMVDVATAQINLSTGGTDTVVYEPEE